MTRASKQIPDDWQPTPETRLYCEQKGVDPDVVAEAMRLHEWRRAYSDWDRVCRSWALREWQRKADWEKRKVRRQSDEQNARRTQATDWERRELERLRPLIERTGLERQPGEAIAHYYHRMRATLPKNGDHAK